MNSYNYGLSFLYQIDENVFYLYGDKYHFHHHLTVLKVEQADADFYVSLLNMHALRNTYFYLYECSSLMPNLTYAESQIYLKI